MPWNLTLRASELASPDLSADLAKDLADKISVATDRGAPAPAVDEAAKLRALVVQAAGLAKTHGFRGPGRVELNEDEVGRASVHVRQETPPAAALQPFDAEAAKAVAPAPTRKRVIVTATPRAAGKKPVTAVSRTHAANVATAKAALQPPMKKKPIPGARTRPAPAAALAKTNGPSPASRPTLPSRPGLPPRGAPPATSPAK